MGRKNFRLELGPPARPPTRARLLNPSTPSGNPKIIFYQRTCSRLTARRVPLDHQCFQAFRRAVNTCRCESRRSAANDNQIIKIRSWPASSSPSFSASSVSRWFRLGAFHQETPRQARSSSPNPIEQSIRSQIHVWPFQHPSTDTGLRLRARKSFTSCVKGDQRCPTIMRIPSKSGR